MTRRIAATPAGNALCHPTFAAFRAAVQDVLDRVPMPHAETLASLMTPNFPEFDDVSFLTARSIFPGAVGFRDDSA
jgi:hypothetical protein